MPRRYSWLTLVALLLAGSSTALPRSVLEIENVLAATSQIAQTILRSVLGGADLDALLAERERLNEHLQQIIDDQTEPWGDKVLLGTAVEHALEGTSRTHADHGVADGN